MQLLHSSYCWQMKVIRVVPTRTYQCPYAKCHAYTMYPAWNMHLSTLHTAHPTNQLHQPLIFHTHLPDQCAATYPSVVTAIQWTLHIVPVIQPQTPLTSRTRISKQYPWTMNIGQQKWFQKEHSAYMRMDYLIMCAHTHALMDIMAPPHI